MIYLTLFFNLAALGSVPLSFQKPELPHQINESRFLRVWESIKLRSKEGDYASSSAVSGEVEELPIHEELN